MTSLEVRKKFLKFFEDKKHARIIPARLVLDGDTTTLFTSSGMQPLIPYLMGETHPDGVRLVDSQPCFREVDIEEVGDNRHTTFFEMLGNWSLGDYFKKEEIDWLWQFLTVELGLPKDKLHVTVFEGNEIVPKDEEAFSIWKSLGVAEDHIHFYGVGKNWWSRSGKPSDMPVGEIGGPDTEVFFEFSQIEHDPKFGDKCHPNCDCGRFMEICNSVFIQYKKTGDGEFEELPQKNVDFGGGLERLLAAVNNEQDVFKNDSHSPIVEKICEKLEIKYDSDAKTTASLRVISDHIKAAVFLIKAGVIPSNKLHGYVLRRLLRRAAVKLYQINKDSLEVLPKLVDPVEDIYEGTGYFEPGDWDQICQTISDEMKKFQATLNKGLKEIERIDKIDGKIAFDLYQSYGFPAEITEELLKEKGLEFDKQEFKQEFDKHRELSRTASAGMFKGGLAGHSEIETKYHTATHLLHQALRDVLGPEVFQKGSNITTERLRFDFSYDKKPTPDELKRVEELINKAIEEDLKVERKFMGVDEAYKLNAIGLFNDKYAKDVSIYCIGPDYSLDPNSLDQRPRDNYYSLEFCGGPHVEHTSVIGRIKLLKEEAVSAGVRRIYAEIS